MNVSVAPIVEVKEKIEVFRFHALFAINSRIEMQLTLADPDNDSFKILMLQFDAAAAEKIRIALDEQIPKLAKALSREDFKAIFEQRKQDEKDEQT